MTADRAGATGDAARPPRRRPTRPQRRARAGARQAGDAGGRPTRPRCPTTAATPRRAQQPQRHRALRRRVLHLERRRSTTPTTRRCEVEREVGRRVGGLRRPVRRDAGDARVPAGRGRRRATCGRPGVEVDGALRGVRLAVRPGERRARDARRHVRFVVDGQRREGARGVPYHLVSSAFAVQPWSGITVERRARGPGGRVAFTVGPRHTSRRTAAARDRPRSARSTTRTATRRRRRFIKDERTADPRPRRARRRARSSSGTASPAASGRGSTPASDLAATVTFHTRRAGPLEQGPSTARAVPCRPRAGQRRDRRHPSRASPGDSCPAIPWPSTTDVATRRLAPRCREPVPGRSPECEAVAPAQRVRNDLLESCGYVGSAQPRRDDRGDGDRDRQRGAVRARVSRPRRPRRRWRRDAVCCRC